jgi:arsenate reductase
MTDAFPITIYHNPACQTSRNTLAIIRSAGYAPKVVEYLKVGWTRPELEALFKRMDVRPREAMRLRGSPAAELGLLAASATDDQILEAMTTHPILVERPIVVTPLGAKLARPADGVLTLLERQPPNTN